MAILQISRISEPLGDLPSNIDALNRASYLDGLARLMRYYDEVLTQSVRNYAFTQDEQWVERYQSAEPELERVIGQAIANGDEQDLEFFSSIEKANTMLVEIEHHAIDLVDGGRPGEAIALLEGPEYREQKRAYEQGLKDYVEMRGAEYDDAMRVSTGELDEAVRDIRGIVSETTQLILVAVPVVLIGTAVIGFLIFFSVTRPILGLRQAANEIAAGNFDVRIDKRDDEMGELASQLDSMRGELKRKHLLKDEFLSIASHELKSPIQPIMGYIDLAKKGYIPYEEAVDGILPQAARLEQLANDILDVSRIESGDISYHIEKVKVDEVISNVVGAARAYLKGEVSLEARLDRQGETVEIDADKSRITQVLSNIVGNATKFTKKGTIRVESNTSIERNFIEIKVSDTGAGIPEEIVPNLFGKFVTSSYKDGEHKGTGLGLYISKNIVEAHRGKIAGFNNGNGGGATFVITLPISRDEKMLLS